MQLNGIKYKVQSKWAFKVSLEINVTEDVVTEDVFIKTSIKSMRKMTSVVRHMFFISNYKKKSVFRYRFFVSNDKITNYAPYATKI